MSTKQAANAESVVVPDYALDEIQRIVDMRRRAPGEFTTNEFARWLEKRHGKKSNWEEATKVLTELRELGIAESRNGIAHSTDAILWRFINPNQESKVTYGTQATHAQKRKPKETRQPRAQTRGRAGNGAGQGGIGVGAGRKRTPDRGHPARV